MANAFRPASSAALLLAAALAACSSSVQDLPPGGVVVCSSSGDCPSGTICQALLGRCISAASDDRQPPALVAGSSQVTPPAATAGTLVTVAFTVDEDLALDPEVRFDGATSLLGTPRRSGRSYTLSFPASAADGEGSHNVVARLVDLSGNVAATVPVGSLTLDFTPPSAAPPAVTPAFARSGSTLTAVISFSEPLDGSPTLAIDLGPALTATPGPGPGTWTFARTLDGSEPEGAVDLLLTARDPAGNELRRRTTAAAILDFTAPSVAASSIHTPAVRAGDTFVAEVHFDEPMGGLPTVVLAPAGGGTAQPVTAGEVDASTFALAYQVPAGAADGAFELRLTGAADRAGNPALPQLLGAVTLDSTPPAISGAIAVSPAKAAFKAGDQPSITFTASEAVPVPEASLGTAVPIDAPCVAAGPARTFTCTLSRPLAASDLPEGVNALLVKLTDAAGNVGYGSRALTLDYAPAGLSGAPVTQLIPGPGNLRTTIAALGPGSTLRVVLLASEPLSADPSVWAQSGQTGEILPLSRTSSNGTSYVYQLTLDSALRTPATWTLYWDPVDLAGNQWPAAGKPPVATFPVDGEAPAAPAVGTAAAPAITWERVPWGSQATGGAALYRVSGAASSVPGADLAVAWDGPAAGARELGRGAIGAGGFDVSLGADPAELYLSSVDPAGNESPRTRIVDVAWTAGLGGKVPGSTFENPHRLVRRTFSTRALAQNDDVEVAGSALGLAGDGLVVATDAASTFKPVSGTESPAARRYYALGYDAGRGAVVLYGGQLSGGSTPGDTWEWDGAEWRQVVPLDPEGDGNPPTWDGAAMAYDPIRGGVVLLTTNLWLWNGQSWRMLDYGMVAPGLQQFGAAAWDQARGVLVFFGGGFGNHTWEWDGTSWADVTPASPTDSPDGRSYHQLAWDPIRQRVVVFGGLSLTAPSGARNDLWAWDGTRWTQLTPSGTPPSGRTDFAMAWDAQNGELVVQGGYDAASVKDGKTFVLRTVSGTPTWLDLTPLGSPAFSSHRAVFDQRTNRVELFGDWSGPQLLQWAGSGSPSWIPRAPGDPEADGNPSFSWLTNDGSIAYDSSRGVVVYQDMRQQQTWEWNRASWARKANGTGVTPRSGGTIGNYGAYTILFGGAITGSGTGSAGDTWRWDGTSWTQLIASPPRSPLGHYATLREDVGMATDPVSGRLYRFGGGDQYSGGLNCYNDLQYWNGSAWVLQGGHPGSWADPEGDGSPASFLAGGDPTESCGPRGRVAWDEGRGSLVVYVPFQGFWEWKPGTNSWARHTMPVGPFSDEAVFYDRTLGAVVVLEDASAWVADLAADTWLPLPFANPYGLVPPANGLAAFDRGLGRLVGVELATWIWDAGTTASPAHLLRVDYSRANGPDPGACVVRAACPIQRVDVSWVGGGTSPSQDGAMLQAWTGDWLDAQATGASAAAPALVSWSWTPASPFPASSLFHGASRELTFELIPRGSTSAAGLARVATDAVEVTVRYRRP